MLLNEVKAAVVRTKEHDGASAVCGSEPFPAWSMAVLPRTRWKNHNLWRGESWRVDRTISISSSPSPLWQLSCWRTYDHFPSFCRAIKADIQVAGGEGHLQGGWFWDGGVGKTSGRLFRLPPCEGLLGSGEDRRGRRRTRGWGFALRVDLVALGQVWPPGGKKLRGAAGIKTLLPHSTTTTTTEKKRRGSGRMGARGYGVWSLSPDRGVFPGHRHRSSRMAFGSADQRRPRSEAGPPSFSSGGLSLFLFSISEIPPEGRARCGTPACTRALPGRAVRTLTFSSRVG